MTWCGAVVIGSDAAFESGPERSWAVGDVADVVRPHPLMRGGAADVGTIGDGDVVTIGDGDMVTVGDSDVATVGDGDMVTVGDGDMVTIGDGDVVTVGDGDMAWLAGVGVSDEHALA